MSGTTESSPVSLLRKAISKAYPNHTDLSGMHLDNEYAHAWQNFARALAINPAELALQLAPIFGLEAAPSLTTVTSEALAQLPLSFCQNNYLLPLRLEGDVLVIATSNPTDQSVAERARFLAGRRIKWLLASPQAIEDAQVFAFSKEAERISLEQFSQEFGGSVYDENSIVRLARTLMQRSIAMRASDLHVQPFLGAYVARVRVDGVLRRLTMLPDAVAITLIRHIKVVGTMDPTNFLTPQDGRMSMEVDGRDFEMRLSTLPASRGERLVIRFLDQSRVHRLNGAGFSHAALQTIRRTINRPSGLIVMTGPTGSGKTSTLYAILSELNGPSVNIITVEDPVEYRIPGISQVEVNNKAGRTFENSLRSMLRQDPDIVLIGEIRDRETAEIAAQAALTGHLVLSTIHTNDALTAIPRLLNLGIQPSILADALISVVAQRLCRSLCPSCKTPVTDPLTPEEQLFFEITHNKPAFRPKGCTACNDTGFRGRLPIVDIVEITEGLRDAIAVGEARLNTLEKLRTSGLKSLAASGSLRVISGETTVKEVVEAVGPSFWSEISRHYGSHFDQEVSIDIHHNLSSGQGVLVMTTDSTLVEQLSAPLDALGFRIVTADSAEGAHDILVDDEEITFIIGDVPEGSSAEAAAEQLRKNRLHIAWARLPALVLLPGTLAAAQEEIRLSGVMGKIMIKPASATDIASHIRRAQAR